MYTFPDNFRAFKALIAAQYSGADVKISPGFKFGETNKSKSFLEKFPLGKVCYRDGSGGSVGREIPVLGITSGTVNTGTSRPGIYR